MTDFLEEPIARPIPGITDLSQALVPHYEVLCDIRRELMKRNPDVLAVTKVQGDNTIASGDESDHKVYFEIGGKAATVYRLLIYSTYTGDVAVSINGMGDINDGILLRDTDQPLVMDLSVDSVYVRGDGAHAIPINVPSDPTNGGVYIYGFTIPDYDRRRDAPLPTYNK